LLRALGHIHRIVERRTTLAILNNVLLEATPKGLMLRATDMEIDVTETVPCDVAQEGSTTLPAHTFHDLVRKLPDGAHVSLDDTAKDGQLVIRSGRARFTLQCLPAADFPDITVGELPYSFAIPGEALKRLITKTQFAISSEETRYYLNGVFLHLGAEEGKSFLRAVATDGHRLARIQMDAPAHITDLPGVIFPRKAVGETLKLIDDYPGDVQISLSTQKIRIEVGSVVLVSKLIDGTFPEYSRVIPWGNDKHISVSKTEFRASVDRVSTISQDRGRAIALAFADDRLSLSVNNPDQGRAQEEIEVDYSGPPIEIGFNSRYLLDISAAIDGDRVLIDLSDPGSPCVIRDPANDGALYVLMPLRI